MAALSDVFVRVRPDTTGLAPELKADVEAAAARVQAKVNVSVRADLDRSVLKAEIAKMRAELARTGDVSLKPKIALAAGELTRLENGIAGSIRPTEALFRTAIVAGATAAAPIAGAAIVGGLGLAGIGAGIALALQDPATKNAVIGVGNDLKSQLVEAATPFREALVNSVQTVGSALSGAMPEIQQAFATLAPVLEKLSTGLGGALTNAMPGFVQGIQAASGVLSTFAGELPELGSVVGGFFTMLNNHGDDLKAGITFAMHVLEDAIKDVGAVLGGLMDVAGPVFKLFNNSAGSTKLLTDALITGYAAMKTWGIAAAVLEPIIVGVSKALVFMGAAEDIATEPLVGLATAAVTVGTGLAIWHELNKNLTSSIGSATDATDAFNAAVTQTPPPLQATGERAANATILIKEFGITAQQAYALLDQSKGVVTDAATSMLNYDDAVRAVTEKQQTLKQAVTDTAAAETQANHAVTESRDAAAQADYGYTQALQGKKDATTAYNKAVADEKKAEAGMADARKTAIQNLKDLKLAVLDAKNAQDDSTLSVDEAQAQLNALQGVDPSSFVYREAQRKLADAQASHADAVNNSAKATDKYADAQKKGINGSDAVVAQQQKISDAHDAVTKAKQSMASADHAVTQAELAQRNAHWAVTDALSAQSKALAANKKARQDWTDWNSKNPTTAEGSDHLRLGNAVDAAKKAAFPPTLADVSKKTYRESHRGKQYPGEYTDITKMPTQLGPSDTGNTGPNGETGFWQQAGKDAGDFWHAVTKGHDPKWAGGDRGVPWWKPSPGGGYSAITGDKIGTKGNAISFKIDTASLKDSSSTWDKFTGGLKSAFNTNFGSGVSGFFKSTVPSLFGSLGTTNLPTLDKFTTDAHSTTKTGFFDKVGSFFTSTVPSLFTGLGTTNLPTLGKFATDSNTKFNTGFTDPFSGIFNKTVPSLFGGLSTDVDGVWNAPSTGIVATSKAGNIAVGVIMAGALAALNKVGQPFGVSVGSLDTPGSGGAADPQHKKAAGGPIEGPGGPTDDAIPAMLSNGEFVHQASAVDYYGKDFMQALNDKKLPKFATGGAAEKQAAKTVKSYGLKGVKPWVAEAADVIGRMFGIKTVGGYSKTGSVANSDHPKGLALDFMTNNLGKPTVSNPVGTALANYVWANQKGLGITYEIWNRHIRSVARAKEGWRNYSGPSAHTDHVHVSFLDHAGSGDLTGGQGLISGIGDVSAIAGASAAIAPFQAKLAKLNFLGQIGSGFLGKLADSIGGGTQDAPAGYNAVPAGVSQKYAAALLAKYGWGSDQFGPLKTMWNYESGWNVHAANSIGAYGIPQALPGSKMASVGKDWHDNYKTQVQWGLGYIKNRYGSPAKAWSHWEKEAGGPGLPHKAQGWYDKGGWLTDDETLVHRDTKRPEAVLSPDESENYKKMAQNGGGIDEARLARLIGIAVVQALQTAPPGNVNLDHNKVGDFVVSQMSESLRL